MTSRHAVACALALICAVTLADPCPMAYSGGTLRPMDDHPSVSLTEETLVIDPLGPTCRITATMVLENRGEACEVLTGFPVLAHSADRGYYPMDGIAIAVDGAPVEPAKCSAPLTLAGKEAKCRWYTFTVAFAADQRRTLTAWYAVASHELVRAPYILSTGSRWHGDIGSLRVEVPVGDLRNFPEFVLEGDKQPLQVTEQDGKVIWTATNYAGQPEVIWLKSRVGPYEVVIGGPHDWEKSPDGARWHGDRLLLSADVLRDVLMLQKVEVEGGQARLTKEDKSILVPCHELPSLSDEGNALFVYPVPALEAWGARAEVSPDGPGGTPGCLHLTPPFGDVAAVRKTALWLDQVPEYRLRCLRHLAEKAPEECNAAAAEIAGRDADEAFVQRWAICRTVGLDPQSADLTAAEDKLHHGSPGSVVSELVGLVLATGDDTVLRGAAALMAHIAPDLAARELLDRFLVYNPWFHGSRQARNAGLALRVMGVDGLTSLETIIAADGGKQKTEDAMLALAMLGDDAAIPTLVAYALNRTATTDARCAGAQGLALIGTPEALKACARVARECDDLHVYSYAVKGLQLAFDPAYKSLYDPHPAPDWARALTREEARRIVAPLLAELVACARNEDEKRMVGHVQRVMDGLRAEAR